MRGSSEKSAEECSNKHLTMISWWQLLSYVKWTAHWGAWLQKRWLYMGKFECVDGVYSSTPEMPLHPVRLLRFLSLPPPLPSVLIAPFHRQSVTYFFNNKVLSRTENISTHIIKRTTVVKWLRMKIVEANSRALSGGKRMIFYEAYVTHRRSNVGLSDCVTNVNEAIRKELHTEFILKNLHIVCGFHDGEFFPSRSGRGSDSLVYNVTFTLFSHSFTYLVLNIH